MDKLVLTRGLLLPQFCVPCKRLENIPSLPEDPVFLVGERGAQGGGGMKLLRVSWRQ